VAFHAVFHARSVLVLVASGILIFLLLFEQLLDAAGAKVCMCPVVTTRKLCSWSSFQNA
jgi:hypothetical protein